jgi:hypothetical protein
MKNLARLNLARRNLLRRAKLFGALSLMAVAYQCTPLAAQSPETKCSQSIGDVIDAANRSAGQSLARAFRGEPGRAAT